MENAERSNTMPENGIGNVTDRRSVASEGNSTRTISKKKKIYILVVLLKT